MNMLNVEVVNTHKDTENKMFIQNVSYENIKSGNHLDAGDNSLLIQIVEPGFSFPKPKNTFTDVLQFEFNDVVCRDEDAEKYGGITVLQALTIVMMLELALVKEQNVIVHCSAGKCRSGAVAEFGIRLGFVDTKTPRMPNRMVLKKLLEVADMEYNPEIFNQDENS